MERALQRAQGRLRDPASQAWCKKLLEDGVCATIGPLYEPYLGSFPRPNEFFALLLQGELTLVECYSRTSPFNSWMLTLIGDPLYRPFKYRAVEGERGRRGEQKISRGVEGMATKRCEKARKEEQ